MSFKKFLISRIFLLNFIAAVAATILLITITMAGIRLYTNHGKAFPVPDLTGLSELEVKGALSDEKLNYKIIDSVYVSDKKPGSVVDQLPKPGFKVKQNRTILLTVNAMAPETVKLPKLRDISYRQAQVLLEISGLVLGNVSFKPSEFNNLVLNALSEQEEVFAGDILTKGSMIDLVIGKSSGFEKTPVPDLAGLTIREARNATLDALLNPGVIIYDESVQTSNDSTTARIWKQRPDPRTAGSIDLGTSIDIWVTVDKQKLIEALEN